MEELPTHGKLYWTGPILSKVVRLLYIFIRICNERGHRDAEMGYAINKVPQKHNVPIGVSSGVSSGLKKQNLIWQVVNTTPIKNW